MTEPQQQPLQILILGDGNMSYSYNLFQKLLPYAHTRPFYLTATSFDTHQELLHKYPGTNNFLQSFHNHPQLANYYGGVNACDILQTLTKSKSDVIHNNSIDLAESTNNSATEPTNISSHLSTFPLQYDSITFNNPHIGIEDFLRHISLLSHFFKSASTVLKPLGQIFVTLCDDQPNRWELFQSAYQNGYICFAAIELTPAEWPYFQNKRHQNDTAFPYNTMIQYAFMRRSDLAIDPKLQDLIVQLFSRPISLLINNGINFDLGSQNPSMDDSLASTSNQSSPSIFPDYFFKWDMSVWKSYALSLLPSKSFENLSQSSTRATNFGNWASTDQSFIPIFKILQPQYAWYTSKSSPIFNIYLTLDHVIAAYSQQDIHFNQPIAYQSYLQTSHSQQPQLLESASVTSSADDSAFSTQLTQSILPKSSKRLAKSTVFTPEEIKLISTQLINVPQGFDIPPQFDSKFLGRPLTQREVIKFERYLQRVQPKENKQKKHLHNQQKSLQPTQKTSPCSNTNHASQSILLLADTPTPTQTGQIICVQCPQSRSFTSTESLNQHIKIKHNQLMGSYLKPNYEVQANLIRIPVLAGEVEIPSQFESLAPLVCTVCNIAFPDNDSLKMHYLLLAPPQTSLTCDTCLKVYANPRALAQHVSLKHPIAIIGSNFSERDI